MPWNWSTWSQWAQNAILNLRDAVKAWGERETELADAERKVRWQAGALGGLLHNTRMELFSLKRKVEKMDAQLQKVDDDLKAAKVTLDGLAALVTADGDTIKSLQQQITILQTQPAGTAVSADDLAKLAADADALAASNANAAALLPKPIDPAPTPAPASTDPAPTPAAG